MFVQLIAVCKIPIACCRTIMVRQSTVLLIFLIKMLHQKMTKIYLSYNASNAILWLKCRNFYNIVMPSVA